jgi:AcrR family transcriptional regulator
MDKVTGMPGKSAARDAILLAFADIILESGYEKVRVLDVVARSGVARSTFYEHFQSREDLLRESMRGPFETLAQLVVPTGDLTRVASTLDHFMQNRALAKSVMANPGTNALIDVLSELIEARSGAFLTGIAARAVAGGQMAAISSWLDGKDTCTADDLAQTLQAMSLALLTSLRNGQLHSKEPLVRRSL